MMRADELLVAIEPLREPDLELWIREELVIPAGPDLPLVFTAMECARIRLICTLHYELEIELDALQVVLLLMDQLYDTRRQLRALSAAVARQAPAVRQAITAHLDAHHLPDRGRD